MSLEVWNWVLDVNLRGVIHGVHVFGPVLVEQRTGHIVCTSSTAGVSDTATVGPYGATKHAVVGLAAALRNELAGSGVGVSVLCPGLTNTRIFESERTGPMEWPIRPEATRCRSSTGSCWLPAGRPRSTLPRWSTGPWLDDQFFVFPTSDFDGMIEARIADIREGFAWRDRTAASMSQPTPTPGTRRGT